MASKVETKIQELLQALEEEQRPSDWENRIRMFAGNDRRILDRIPITRQKVAIHKMLKESLLGHSARLKEVEAQYN